MASNPENVRLTVLMKLQEAIDEEVILEEQILALMHRFADRFTDRRVEINNLIVLYDHPLVDYGKYALGCMTGADMKKCVYLRTARDELLRSMEEKRQLMANYKDMFRVYKSQPPWQPPPLQCFGPKKTAMTVTHIKVNGVPIKHIQPEILRIAKALVAYYQKFVDEESKKEIKDVLVRYDMTLLVADP
ncbi:hypothetical protein Tco_0878313 [Tanacetum coccineum]|uniref:Uncharacterized protein n=1 Tax=Tanacetum coccineum TaxID=301880 RepID=A0ABQ5C0J5_9ASTR